MYILHRIYKGTGIVIAKQARKTPRRSRGSKPGTIAEPPPPPYIRAPATARVFRSGNSQAVRLPKEFRFKATEVQVFRRGDDVVLREKPVKLSQRFADLPPLPDDAFPDQIPDRAAEPVEDV